MPLGAGTLVPPEVVVLPPEVLLMPPEVEVLPPEVVLLPPEVLVLVLEDLLPPLEVLVLPPEVLVDEPVLQNSLHLDDLESLLKKKACASVGVAPAMLVVAIVTPSTAALVILMYCMVVSPD